MPSFVISGLPPEPFQALFALPDAELRSRGAMRVTAGAKPGYPCRVSLADAEVGEQLLLLRYEHQPEESPYRASGPIFVRQGAQPARLAPGVIPDAVASRLISVRAYDALHWMIDAAVCEGTALEPEIERLWSNRAVAYLHLHHAMRGCYSCRVDRLAR
jgi:hypothetical protein